MLGAVRSFLTPNSESTPDDTTDTTQRGVDVDVDDAYKAMSNSRRRHIIQYLASDTPESTTGELADLIAGIETDDGDNVDTNDRKAVYICLYQEHLPALDRAGIIEYGDRGHAVQATPVTYALADVLSETERRLNGGDA